jgi:hypothetical protein
MSALVPAAYGVGCALLWVEIGIGDRYPIPWVLALIAFVGMNLAAGAVLGGRWIPLMLLVFIGGVVTAGVIGDPAYTKTMVAVLLTGIAGLLFGLGVPMRPLLERARLAWGGRAVRIAGCLLAAAILLPVPIAIIGKHRTVRVTGDRPTLIDETRGTVNGVGLGATSAQVVAAFGRPPSPWTSHDPVTPLNGDDSTGGPGHIPARGLHSRSGVLRYPDYSFYLQDDRVWTIEIVDQGAHTKRGVGVGDSMSLVQKAYPQLDCSEGDRGEDEPDPYPVCTGQTGPQHYMFFGGEYSDPGIPVKSITIFSRPLR